jgi:hypothetical protein
MHCSRPRRPRLLKEHLMRRPLVISFVAGCAAAAALVSSVAAIASTQPAAHVDGASIDGRSPSLEVAPISFVVGSTIDAVVPFDPNECDFAAWHFEVPMRLSWSGNDGKKAVDHYDVWAVPTYMEPFQVLADTVETTLDVLGGNYDSSCGGPSMNTSYRIEASDKSGNGATAVGDTRADMAAWQEDGTTVPNVTQGTVTTSRIGLWTQTSCTCSDAGHTLTSSLAGATATFTVTPEHAGQWFAVVMPKGTNRGAVAITVDGGLPTIVDTYAQTLQNRAVVWQTQLSKGTHLVVVANAGTPGRSRVDLDAVLLS